MEAIDLLTSRTSSGAFAEPGPDDSQLATILKAAVRAPDHGRVRPWRFLVIRGAARSAFAEVMVEALKKRDPEATPPLLDKEREKPMRAPLIVAVVAAIQKDHPKIPAVEQLLAAGAAAHNIMLAANALGFAAAWKTGEPAYDPTIKKALGVGADDQIVGYMYLGSPKPEAAKPPSPDAAKFVTEWTQPAA
jgi:nitroreductase